MEYLACVCLALATRIDPENGEVTSVYVAGFAECAEDLISLVFEMPMLSRGRAVLQTLADDAEEDCTGCVLTGMRGILKACHIN